MPSYVTNAWFSQQSPKLGWVGSSNIITKLLLSIRYLGEVRSPTGVSLREDVRSWIVPQAEDVLGDLGVRQAMRFMPENVML